MLELGLAEIAEVAPREGEDMDLRTTLSVTASCRGDSSTTWIQFARD